VFEVKILDRMFTLYTTDNVLMEKFVLYIEKILELKEEMRYRQYLQDIEMEQLSKDIQRETRR